MRGVILLMLLACSINGAEKISGDHYKKVIFSDDFSKELSKKWRSYKSESKTQDGVLIGLMPVGADHNSVNSIVLPPHSDVEVSLKFKFEGSPNFTVAFNDSKYKGAHAGHICRVQFKLNGISMRDGKTGIFKNEIWAKKKAGNLDNATKELLKTKQKNVSRKFEKGKWYKLQIRLKKDLMQV